MTDRSKDIELQRCAEKIIAITGTYTKPKQNYISMLYSNMLYVNSLIGQEMERELDKIRKEKKNE